MWRDVFSSTTIASSTTKPVAMVSAISVKLLTEKPAQVHDAEGADQRHRHRHARDQRRAAVAQEQEHDQDHQHDRDRQRALRCRAATRGSSSCAPSPSVRSIALGIDARSDGSSARDAVDGLDDVGVGLAVDDHEHRRLAVGHAGVAQVLHRVDDVGDVGELHRGAVAVGDDQRQVLGGGLRLVVGVDLPVPVAVLDRRPWAGWRWRRRAPRARPRAPMPYLLSAGGIELDAHRGQRAAADAHLADALHLRQLLREDRRCGVVHLALRHRVRGQRRIMIGASAGFTLR